MLKYPGSDFELGLKVSVKVRTLNQKPRTRNQHDQLFSPKTAGHSIFGPPSDYRGYYQNGSIASKHSFQT